jgi:uncharacterized protein
MALPTLIDPRKLANQGIVLEGQFHDQHLPRLAKAVAIIETPLSALVKFEIDEARAKVASGTLSISVSTVCQRCLDPVTVALSSEFAAQVIWSEDQLSNVPSDREPWIVVDKMASLNELLEDEILLALPSVNYHENGMCTGDTFLPEDERGNNEEDDQVVADNPFNILQQLKK